MKQMEQLLALPNCIGYLDLIMFNSAHYTV